MRRRRFLQQAGAFSLVATATGPFVHASDKTGTRHPIIGKGDHQYECHHGWGAVPDHIHWHDTHGTAVDRDGLVYITHRGGPDRVSSLDEAQDTVVVFEPDGTFVRSFGKEYHGGGHGIDIREEEGEEYLYLCQMFPINLVVKTTRTGEVVWVKGRDALDAAGVYADPATKYSPTNLAFAPDGGFYVTDGYGSNYVHRFDAQANWVATFGGTGTEPGRMRTAHGIWLDDRAQRGAAELVVADRANARLQYFGLDGTWKSIVDEVLFPAHFDIKDDLLLVPDLHARISLFGPDNAPIVHLGDDPAWIEEVKKLKIRQDPSQWVDGKFVHPHDACFDRDGNIYVAEWVTSGRVSFLRRV